MSKELVLYNYNREAMHTGFFYDEFSEIGVIQITIISGDEIADIWMKDGTTYHFDAGASRRIVDFYDNFYTLYNCFSGLNRLDQFENRGGDTYWMIDNLISK